MRKSNAEKARRRYLKRKAKILLDKETEYYYIKKEGLYYRPNSCGYTSFLEQAGVYCKKNAVGHLACDSVDLVPIGIIVHNANLTKKANDILSRIIS